MNRKMFFKLAGNNIRKNKNVYFPFILMGATMICVFYMMYAIELQADMADLRGGAVLGTVLDLGVKVTGFLSVLIVFYTNSFLMKKRTSEIGLYNILGLEKKHIRRMLTMESAIVVFTCIASGLITGIVLSKLVFMFLLKLVNLSSSIPFTISVRAIIITIILFACIYTFTLIYNCCKISISRPVEMLRNANVGEREPKSKWILGLLGIVTLGIGYFLAVHTNNGVEALNQFFFAVLFVIVGTYLLFMTGSIIFLKILKKNKNFYYNKKHFTTISGMIYRMKQNAAGLSSICLLSTAVILTLATTFSLYIGIDDIIDLRFPYNAMQEYNIPDNAEQVDFDTIKLVNEQTAKDHDVSLKDLNYYYSFELYGTLTSEGEVKDEFLSMNDYAIVTFLTYDDYMRLCKGSVFTGSSLQDNEVFISTPVDKYKNMENLTIGNCKYKVADNKYDEVCTNIMQDSYFKNFNGVIVITKDLSAIKKICLDYSGSTKELTEKYSFNIEGDKDNAKAFCQNVESNLKDAGVNGINSIKDRYSSYDDAFQIYGGLIFVGIFVGLIFLLTTVLIIYYKQISEGISDRDKFVIMRKVGMSDHEVKKVIKDQILIVFFVPVVVAVIHIGFSFDMMKKIMALFNLENTGLFIRITAITIVIFTLIYTLVYTLTAKTYYKLTNTRK